MLSPLHVSTQFSQSLHEDVLLFIPVLESQGGWWLPPCPQQEDLVPEFTPGQMTPGLLFSHTASRS